MKIRLLPFMSFSIPPSSAFNLVYCELDDAEGHKSAAREEGSKMSARASARAETHERMLKTAVTD